MARLPGRHTELPLRALLLVALLLPGPGGTLQAQAGPGEAPDSPGSPGAFVQGGLRLTRIAGSTGVLGGGAVGLDLGHGIRIGGGGWILLEDSDLEGAGAFQSRTLGVGYGGATVEVGLPGPTATVDLAARALLGAGNVDIRDPITGIRINSSNFAVFEPEILARLELSPKMALEGSVSYRAVFGLDTLEGVAEGDVGGPGLAILFRIGPFS